MAEKARVYFNEKNIPVAFTSQDFDGFAISSILKILNEDEYEDVKGIKTFSMDKGKGDIATTGRSSVPVSANFVPLSHRG